VSDTNQRTIADEGFLTLVQQLCHEHVEEGITPDIIFADSIHGNSIKWITVRYRSATGANYFPNQGWKLHVSAHHTNAEEILARVVPILSARAIPWKCAPTRLKLQSLNQGEGGLSQIGKFITIYPATDEQSVALAVELDHLTQGLSGPSVPSDRALNPSSLVHYRYGGYTNFQIQTPIGQIINAILLPDGSYVKDVRSTQFRTFPGIEDPFERAGLYVPPAPPSRLFGGRFFYISTVHRNSRNSVYLTVDIQEGCHAILKQVSLEMRVGKEDLPANEMLRHEAKVLEAIGHDEHLPSFYALFEQSDSLCLAMEAVDGVTMERFITEKQVNHQLPSTADVVRWAKDLVRMLAPVHAGGWVHRDIKSTNILVTADEQMRLIDFDISTALGSPTPRIGFGTRGYQSPQQIAGEPATFQDDIYGLGAVLYGLAGLLETSQAPDGEQPLTRSLLLLNPRLHPALCQVIERCLNPLLEERYASLADLAAALETLDIVEEAPFSIVERTDESTHRYHQRPHFEESALRLANTLVEIARPVLDSSGLAWLSTHTGGAGIRSREINTGMAGVLYVMTEFADKVGDDRYYDAVMRGAEWLKVAPRLSEPMVSGLYIGEAGIAAALLRAGQLLDSQLLLEAALCRADEVAKAPFVSPDLFNGAAGRMRMHLWMWRVTGEPSQLAYARQVGDYLMRMAQGNGDSEAYWTFSEELTDFKGQSQFGYAHGAAGIADTLLDLYEATGEESVLALAVRSARWLMAHAQPVFDGAGVAWSLAASDEGKKLPLRSGFWCHGAAGIGLFLARIGQLSVVSEALEVACRAARAVAFATRWSSTTQCHGLAGNIDFLVTMYQTTGDTTFLDHAHTLGTLLTSFVLKKEENWITPSEYYNVVSPDFMVGYSGVALAFLRLVMPETFLHPFRDETLRTSLLVPA
jgi:serine/threonine protein kinase